MDLDTGRIRCFVEVAERGTVAAAADALGYSGPAVSQQVSKLEGELGVQLFDRVGGRLRLSEVGRRFKAEAHRVLDAMERARGALAEESTHLATVKVVGFPSSVSQLVAPLFGVLGDPKTNPRVTVGEVEDAAGLRELGLGHADITIAQEYSHLNHDRNERFDYHHLLVDPLRLVTPTRFRSVSSLSELCADPWVISGAGTPCEAATLQACTNAGFEPQVIGQVTEHATTLALVGARAAIALVPQLCLSKKVAGTRVSELDVGIKREIYAVTRSSTSSAAVMAVIESLRSVAAEAD